MLLTRNIPASHRHPPLNGAKSSSPLNYNSLVVMAKPKLHRWRISRIRGVPVEFIGYVEAENEKQAIKQAIKQFQISDPKKQRRLVAHRVE